MRADYFDGSTNGTTDEVDDSYDSYDFNFLQEIGTPEQVFSLNLTLCA